MKKNDSIKAVCITADVIGSRKNGKEVELDEAVSLLNKKYGGQSITPFTKRAGDEIFSVLANFSDTYYVLKDLLKLSNQRNIPLYVGVGLGVVNNEHVDNPHAVNGTAIWNSADALKSVKENDSTVKYFRNDGATFRYFLYADDSDVPYKLLNYMISLLFEKIGKRTEKQIQAIDMVEQFPTLTQEAIGKKLGYEKNAASSVGKILYRAEYHFVHETEVEITKLLDQLQMAKQVI